ncbi:MULTISPECIES: CAP domain-containing protein [unclassified Streptomyces]|uniref:CAP domain-containing protein n=1 Tax=unclassified Streptomyces TaxID=2593676 RepID=UPI000A687354|nr:CAP domain-containing protein [Streptomyces sp. CB01883]
MRSRTALTGTALGLVAAAALSTTLVPVTASPAWAQECAASARAPSHSHSHRADRRNREVREAVVCLINAQREQLGLPALTYNQNLTTAAHQHALAAVQQQWWGPGKDSHTNPQTSSTPQSRILGAGYCPNPVSWRVAEITYNGWGGSGTPDAALAWWMNSPPHRANILDPGLREIGRWAQAGAADPAGTGASGAGTYVVTFGSCQQ